MNIKQIINNNINNININIVFRTLKGVNKRTNEIQKYIITLQTPYTLNTIDLLSNISDNIYDDVLTYIDNNFILKINKNSNNKLTMTLSKGGY